MTTILTCCARLFLFFCSFSKSEFRRFKKNSPVERDHFVNCIEFAPCAQTKTRYCRRLHNDCWLWLWLNGKHAITRQTATTWLVGRSWQTLLAEQVCSNGGEHFFQAMSVFIRSSTVPESARSSGGGILYSISSSATERARANSRENVATGTRRSSLLKQKSSALISFFLLSYFRAAA